MPNFWRVPVPGEQSNPGSRQYIYRFPDSRTVFWSNPESRKYPSRPSSLIRRQRIHGSLDNIQEEHEEESEEEVDLAEVDSGDDSKDSYLDSESTDNGSELTEVT